MIVLFKMFIHLFFITQDESKDLYKKQQLRELAMINSQEERSPMACPMSPSRGNQGMKRQKARV